jgi:hypothetical protein
MNNNEFPNPDDYGPYDPKVGEALQKAIEDIGLRKIERDTFCPNPYNHKWDICGMCGPMVECGVCGNNSCNGGNGWEIHSGPNGTAKCPGCDSAHDMMIAKTDYPIGPDWDAKLVQWKIDNDAMAEERMKEMKAYYATEEGKEQLRLQEAYFKKLEEELNP